jgi:hypothetical protein
VRNHRAALIVIATAIVLDTLLGLAFALAENIPIPHGLFCGLANAVTDGCDIAPHTHYGYEITTAEYLLVVPLFAATFSLFTSGLTNLHIIRSEHRMRDHVEERFRHHLGTRTESNGADTVHPDQLESDSDSPSDG